MTIFDEPKVDCHVHVFDPVRFPYGPDTFYAPAGQEIGTASQLLAVLEAYGIGHALVVGPNSAYDTDNRLLLDLLGQAQRRLKGMAVVDRAISGSGHPRASGVRTGHSCVRPNGSTTGRC